jgi:hypothetical protein
LLVESTSIDDVAQSSETGGSGGGGGGGDEMRRHSSDTKRHGSVADASLSATGADDGNYVGGGEWSSSYHPTPYNIAFAYPFVAALSDGVRRVVRRYALQTASMTLSMRLERFVRDAFLPHAAHDSGDTLAAAFAAPDALRPALPGLLRVVAASHSLLSRLWRSVIALPARWSTELCRVLDDVSVPVY